MFSIENEFFFFFSMEQREKVSWHGLLASSPPRFTTYLYILKDFYERFFTSLGSRIVGKQTVGGGRSLRWGGRNREKAKEGEEGRTVWTKDYFGYSVVTLYIRLFCAVGIKEADIKASYPRGSSSFQR